jgi:hypothetical protein
MFVKKVRLPDYLFFVHYFCNSDSVNEKSLIFLNSSSSSGIEQVLDSIDVMEDEIAPNSFESPSSINTSDIPPPPQAPELQNKKKGRPFKKKEIKEKRKYHSLSDSEFYQIKERLNKDVYDVNSLADIY